MLYQLALYALAQSGIERQAVILYPTLATNAADQAIHSASRLLVLLKHRSFYGP
jgi:hypothetical protein